MFLYPVAELFADFNNGQIPLARWQEALKFLPTEEDSYNSSTMESNQRADDAEHHVAGQPTPPEDIVTDQGSTTVLESQAPPGTVPLPLSTSHPPARSLSISPEHDSPPASSQPRRAQSLSAVHAVTGEPTHRSLPPSDSVADPNSKNSTGQSIAERTSDVVEPRRTTGGKSLEYLAKLGLVQSSMMKITLKRGREGDGEGQPEMSEHESEMEDEGINVDADADDADDDDDYVIDPEHRPPKKRRIISARFIDDSDEDVPKRQARPKAKPRVLDDWPVYRSPDPCPQCVSTGKKCYTFVLHPKGWKNQKQRRSCTNCYLKKTRCLFNKLHKEQQEEEAEQKRKRKQDKAKTEDMTDTEREKPKMRKAKDVSDTEDEKPTKKRAKVINDNEREKSKTKKAKTNDEGGNETGEPKKNKGKGKAKRDANNDDDDDDEENDGGTVHRPAPQRPSRSRQVRYRSGEFIVCVFHSIII